MSDLAGERSRAINPWALLTRPNVLLLATSLVLAVLLAFPLTVPIGPFYWDTHIYADAANRIFNGEIPSRDFFAPAGPLGYWLYAAVVALLPDGQPLLTAHWSMALVTFPLLALVLHDVDKRSRGVAAALLLPFLVFAVAPINVEQYSPYPGADGYGIYNRQGAHLLYVLTAALVFVRAPAILIAVVGLSMATLFLTKITAFVAGGLICLLAFAAGRVAFRAGVAALGIFALVLAGLELTLGVVSAYVDNVVTLVTMNEGVLLSRFVQAASLHFKVMAPIGILVLVLLVLEREKLLALARELVSRPSLARLAELLDRDAVWLGIGGFAALFYETQNTGGQAFIFIWPMLLRLVVRANRFEGAACAIVLALCAASALPTLLEVVHRSARAAVGQIRYVELQHRHLGSLGAISQRPEVMERAGIMMNAYSRYRPTYEHFADENVLPSFTMYTELDFQVTYLMTLDEAAGAILDYERANGVRFETIMNLNFVNPLPFILGRRAPPQIAIGADPYRAVPVPDARTLAAVEETDLVLYPTCPVTSANRRLYEFYESGFANHQKITLSPCWDAFVRADLAGG